MTIEKISIQIQKGVELHNLPGNVELKSLEPVDKVRLSTKAKEVCTHDETCPKDKYGCPGHRHGNKNGRLRLTRGDKHLGTIERERHNNFSVQKDNTLLSTLREQVGEIGINKLIPAIRELESHPVQPEPDYPISDDADEVIFVPPEEK